MYIHTPTNTYPYSAAQLKRDNPQTSFPKEVTDVVLASWSVYPVRPTPQPDCDTVTQRIHELAPIQFDGNWLQQWNVETLSPDEIAANQATAAQSLQDSIVAEVQQRLDAFARTRNYDGILSACTYATSPTAKFAAEGQYCVAARDKTWATLYRIMAEVEAGTRPMPASFADIESELPALTWAD